jgi:alkanesulfonate monooxygenase SsuD/methylene tetrahydromethanopterin reductase-like flavin-dependent oxidoreductase (luciferase family)
MDALSGGRFVLSIATGYLRGEYRTLGVDFERRNELFDEALAVIRGVWTTDEFSYEGIGFTARGVSANPKPAHVPIWIGGNSARTRRRVARYGDGWNPFPAPAWLAETARTPVLETLDDLVPMVDHLRHSAEEAGRDPTTIDIAFTTGLPGPDDDAFSADAHLDALGKMAALGVTWSSVGIPGDSLDAAVEALERYGAEVIANR